MRLLGLDIATHTGMALVSDNPEENRVKVVKPSQKGFSRLQSLAAEVERTLLIWEPDKAIIEAYAFCRNIDAFITIVECGTVIKSVLFKMNIPWLEVSPAVLKKWTTGNGHADKDLMAVHVEKKWGFKSESHDAVDAFALAQMGKLEYEEFNLLISPPKKPKKVSKGV